MAFDVQGALDEGYSKAEIADHLAGQSKFDIAAARNEGYADDEILSHLTMSKRADFSFTDALKRGLSSVTNNPAIVNAAVLTASNDPALLLMNGKSEQEVAELRTNPLEVSNRAQARGLAEYNALPENPIQSNVGRAFEDAGGGVGGFMAGVREAATSPILAAKYVTEMLPGGAIGGGLGGALAKAATAKLAAPILKNMAVGSGFNAGATYGGGITPNTAEAFKESGDLDYAKAQGFKQTAAETGIAALMGAPLNVGSNSLRNIAAKALLLSPADEAMQTKAGNSAIGKETTDTDLAVSAILGAISAPGDIAGASMFREKNAAGQQQIAHAEETPVRTKATGQDDHINAQDLLESPDYSAVLDTLTKAKELADAQREQAAPGSKFDIATAQPIETATTKPTKLDIPAEDVEAMRRDAEAYRSSQKAASDAEAIVRDTVEPSNALLGLNYNQVESTNQPAKSTNNKPISTEIPQKTDITAQNMAVSTAPVVGVEEKIRPHLEQLIKLRRVAGEIGISRQIDILIAKAKEALQTGKVDTATFSKAAKLFKDKDARIYGALQNIAQAGTEQSTPKTKSQQRTSHDLLQRIKQLGGIDGAQALDITGEKRAPGGWNFAFRKSGAGLDDLATQLAAEGFAIDTNDVDGGVQQLRDMIRSHINGERNFRHAGIEAQAEKQARSAAYDAMATRAEELGINWKNLTEQQLDDAVYEAEDALEMERMDAAESSDAAIDASDAIVDEDIEIAFGDEAITDDAALQAWLGESNEQTISGNSTESSGTRTQESAGVVRSEDRQEAGTGQEVLQSYTEAEVIQRETSQSAKPADSKPRGGQTIESITKATARLRNGWHGFHNIKIVQSVKEVPNDIYLRALRALKPINQETEGFYDPKTNAVYLISDNIATPERAVWVAAHEVVGHGGIRMLDKSVAEQVDRLSKNGTIEKLAQAIAKDRGETLDKSEHTQEAIAELAAAYVTGDAGAIFDRYGMQVPQGMRSGILGVIARIVEAVRNFMAKVLSKPVADVSDGEVIGLIRQMRDAAEGKAKESAHIDSGWYAMASKQQSIPGITQPPAQPPQQGNIPLQGAQPGNRASWDAPEPTRLDNFIYTIQNKHVDMKRAVEAIKASGAQLADKWDAYLSEELFHGRAAKRTQDFLNTELKPLLVSMAKSGINIDELDQYLHARHAKEANSLIAQRDPGMPDGGSGMTNKQSEDYFSGLEADKRAHLQAAAEQVDAIIANTRDLYVSYGLVSKNQADEWARMFKHYVPLMREDHDGGMGIGQGFSIRGKEVKHRTGSTAAVVDIFANIALQREKAITRGEKNRVAVSLAGLAKLNPNPDFWTFTPVPERRYNQNTGLVEMKINSNWKSADNVIVAKIKDNKGDIQERAVIFNEHNERAVRMANSIHNLDGTQLNLVLNLSAKITRYFASINTQYNPVFGVTNLVRDTQGLLLNLSSTPIAGHRIAVLKNIPSALAGIYADMRAERKGHPASSKWAQLWEELQNEGGMTGYRDLYRTSTERADDIRHELNPYAWHDNMLGKIFTAGGALKVPLQVAQDKAGWLFDWLSDYNQTMEGATRLSAYKVAIEQGMSKPRAASLAKNITVNFNRKGQVGQQAGALYAFFNASMQGSARIGETMFKMDGGDIKTLRLNDAGKAILYGGITLGAMQALALSFAGFDDDEPPEFVRERNVIIPIGGKKYITIPMPLGFHAIPNIGRIATELALSGFKEPGKRAVDMIAVVVNAFNPIGGGTSLLQMASFTATDPLAALAENKDWTGNAIYKEDRSQLSPTPGFTRNKDTATYLSKAIAEGLNSLTGGDKYEQGMFSPTADQLDYLIGQVTGGVGREVSKAWQTGSAAIAGEELPTYKIPLAGRFYGDAGDQSNQGRRFYENLKRINVIEAGLRGRMKDSLSTSQFKADNPDYLLIARANTSEKSIQAWNKRKHTLIESDAPRDKIKAVEDRITAEMKNFNDTVRKVREKRELTTQTQP